MKKSVVFLVILAVSLSGYAQQSGGQGGGLRDKLFFGGGFGLSGGSWGTSISVSPIVGYRVTSRVSAGVGANYTYYRYQDAFFDYSDNRWGGQVFTQIMLVRNIFAWGSYEFINYSYNGDQNDRRTAERIPLGLGLRQPLGGRAAINVIAAYDVLQSSAYNSPWIFTFFFSF